LAGADRSKEPAFEPELGGGSQRRRSDSMLRRRRHKAVAVHHAHELSLLSTEPHALVARARADRFSRCAVRAGAAVGGGVVRDIITPSPWVTFENVDITALIRTVPNFPKPGVMFRDITTLLKNAEGFQFVIEKFAASYRDSKIDKVAAIESR